MVVLKLRTVPEPHTPEPQNPNPQVRARRVGGLDRLGSIDHQPEARFESAPVGAYPKPHTLNPTPYTLNATPYTLHPTP